MAAPDLITQNYLSTMLADMGLTTNQTAMLPSLTTAASRAVRIYCNRYFTRTIWDELYTLKSRDTLVLNQYPVNALIYVWSNPQTVISISNTDNSTNQRARFAIASAGSVDLGLTYTGVSLTRVASGVVSAATVLFSANLTLTALATAVNALGGGWSASVTSGFEKYATADLRGVQGGLSAFSSQGNGLVMHVDELNANLRETTGILDLSGPPNDPFSSPRWGSFMASDYGDQTLVGGTNGIRVQYDAGYDTIPEDVQQAVVEVVQAMISRLDTDPSLSGEKVGEYEWSSDGRVPAIPDSAKEKLEKWRNVRG
jgi:hypothetical protein